MYTLRERVRDALVKNNRVTLLGYIISLISGGFVGYFFRHFKLELSDFITCIFSIVILYFSWVQSNFGKVQLINTDKQLEYGRLQHRLALEQSYATLISEISHDNPQYFIIRNLGNRSAYDIECIVYNNTLDEEHECETIEELYAKSISREYFPSNWLPFQDVILSISLVYEIEEDGRQKRNYYDEFHIGVEIPKSTLSII